MGCGDLRNTLKAIATENINNLHIHVNDFCSPVLARNMVILKIISANAFNPDNEEDFALLWDFWYNLEWPETTQRRIIEILKDLVDGVWPLNVFVPCPGHLESLKEIWRSWLSISTLGQTKAELLMKNVTSER